MMRHVSAFVGTCQAKKSIKIASSCQKDWCYESGTRVQLEVDACMVVRALGEVKVAG